MTGRDRLADLCDTGAARARERARYLARRGEGAATVEYQRGRAAALEQVSALLRSDPGAELYARLSELGTAPAFLGGPEQQPPGWSEGPQGRDDAASGLEEAPPTCILTGARGESADDCTTHYHERPALTR